jgi:hypothetical protein
VVHVFDWKLKLTDCKAILIPISNSWTVSNEFHHLRFVIYIKKVRMSYISRLLDSALTNSWFMWSRISNYIGCMNPAFALRHCGVRQAETGRWASRIQSGTSWHRPCVSVPSKSAVWNSPPARVARSLPAAAYWSQRHVPGTGCSPNCWTQQHKGKREVNKDPLVSSRNKDHRGLYTSPGIVKTVKSRKLRWSGHAARMGETRNAYRIFGDAC